jgi:hypothetical protein
LYRLLHVSVYLEVHERMHTVLARMWTTGCFTR